MSNDQQNDEKTITALKVHQWLEEWDHFNYEDQHFRKRPRPYFFMFALSATRLKALTGIYRRTTEGRELGNKGLGIQRRHDEPRSQEINRYIHQGFPSSTLRPADSELERFRDLRKPGWLPTAIVVNILESGDKRGAKEISDRDLIRVSESEDKIATINLPDRFGPRWVPDDLYPIEVIDGQHRLWAFIDDSSASNFELPVVAFYGLDISWQAYLFWTINIKPKPINPSLAFDLYPLLRTEDWLEKLEGPIVYRETRAQELTESLWGHPTSPWFHRINMLGDPGLRMVSQAAWLRSLMATYVKLWEGRKISIGGLFGSPTGDDEQVLPWSRSQQVAFLIFVWQKVQDAIRRCNEHWASTLRDEHISGGSGEIADPAFAGLNTLLNTDQGVRGVLYITNDLCFLRARELKLDAWEDSSTESMTPQDAISQALESINGQGFATFVEDIADSLSSYDWRTSSARSLTADERTAKLAFRGSSGYREIRRQLLVHLADNEQPSDISDVAATALTTLGY